MPQIDMELLAEEAQSYLDTDPRFFNEDEGSFTWHGSVVVFTKYEEWIVLEVEGVEVEVARP